MPDARLLELDSVSAGYGGTNVLVGLSLSCSGGEVVAVLGANGCGKTTLLRVSTGTLAPSSGTVRIGGSALTGLDRRDVARRVALLAQESGPVFPIAALDTVLLGRHPWRPAFAVDSDEDVAAARAALASVDALDLADRDLMTLSGGERQRVLLARALCQGGELLLCDEPTAHLDLRHQAGVFGLLRGLADRGRGVVVVTHDVELAARVADRIVLLRPAVAGMDSLVVAGSPAEAIRPEHLRSAFAVDVGVERDADGIPRILRSLDLSEIS